MNKKFLLLPLAAMTASVYATEETEVNSSTITGPYSKLIQHSVANAGQTSYFANKNNYIKKEFLNDEQNDISIKQLHKSINEQDDLFTERFNPQDAKDYEDLDTKAKGIAHSQSVNFQIHEEFNDIYFLQDTTKSLTYKDLSELTPDPQPLTMTLNQISTELPQIAQKAFDELKIQNIQQFLQTLGATQITNIPSEIKTEQLQETIQTAITNALTHVNLTPYQKQFKKFEKSQILPTAKYKPTKQYELPTTKDGEIDKDTDEYQTILTKLTQQQEQISKITPELTELQKQLAKANPKVQKTIEKLIPANDLTDSIEAEPIIKELNQQYNNKITEKARQNFIQQFQTQAPELFKKITQQNTSQDQKPNTNPSQPSINQIIFQKFGSKKVVPENIYHETTKTFIFLPNMAEVPQSKMIKLYNDICQQKDQKGQPIITNKNPETWTQDQYLQAIKKVIPTDQQAINYGIKPKNAKINQQECTQDIYKFNQGQQAKFTIAYLINNNK